MEVPAGGDELPEPAQDGARVDEVLEHVVTEDRVEFVADAHERLARVADLDTVVDLRGLRGGLGLDLDTSDPRCAGIAQRPVRAALAAADVEHAAERLRQFVDEALALLSVVAGRLLTEWEGFRHRRHSDRR